LYIFCGDFVFILWILTSGIRSLSLVDIVGKYFYFCRFFFGEEKKRAATFQIFSVYFYEKFVKKVVYLSSSQKNTQVEKKNRLIQSPISQDIEVLKSAIFRIFSTDGGTILFYLCSSWRSNLPKQITDMISSHNFTQFQKTNQPKQNPRSEVIIILNSIFFRVFSGKCRDFLQ
jgi:hypothetical protein